MAVSGRARRLRARLHAFAGGPERLRAIALLACVLGLDSADLGTLGAIAAPLERGLRIDNLQLGMLAAVVLLVAALVTLPIGWLTDRVPRVPLLGGSIVLWSAAMVVSGLAASFVMLLLTRVFLGAVQATSGPTLASLTGDLFPERERGRIFGVIHAGELVGAGFGFVVSGEVAAFLSWRWAFWALSLPGFALAVAVWRALPEPGRGSGGALAAPAPRGEQDAIVHRLVEQRAIEPDRRHVLRSDPQALGVREAFSFLLRIPTNLTVIAAMALLYFFLGGAQTFAVEFIRGHYRLGQASGTALSAVLGIGALAGVLAAGRLTDGMLQRGRLEARISVSSVGFIVAAVMFILPILISQIAYALPLYVLAAGALTAPSAALDAALLDVIPAPLWGRAEGIQTALRTLAQALGPLLFGLSAQLYGGGPDGVASLGAGTGAGGARGLEPTFLVMLVAVGLAGLVLLRARRSYARDVAAAIASERGPSARAAAGG
jgi:MFS family permease